MLLPLFPLVDFCADSLLISLLSCGNRKPPVLVGLYSSVRTSTASPIRKKSRNGAQAARKGG